MATNFCDRLLHGTCVLHAAGRNQVTEAKKSSFYGLKRKWDLLAAGG